MSNQIRVLIVDDSPFVCRLLAAHLQSSTEMMVVGTAVDGIQALAMIEDLQPDVITLDLEMPKMNGLEVLEFVMHDHPIPVVMISGVSQRAAAITLQALEMGAVDFILKYTSDSAIDPEALRLEIIAKVRAAAGIKVIRSLRNGRLPTHLCTKRVATGPETAVTPTPLSRPAKYNQSVVVIGASTGGPIAVRELLSQLPDSFPIPVIVVQHIPASFTEVLASQLDRHVALKVKEAETGDRLQAGVVLVAPGDRHLLLKHDHRIELNDGPKINGNRPSIDVTMQSAAQIFGACVNGVVLTGMGKDGTMGLVAIHSKGGKTFAQDANSAVVNGMPQRAREKGVVDYVAPPIKIAEQLQKHWSDRK